MSGPPHHPHNRQLPATNPPWNPLQVPNFFPRQPQLAHMSNEHSILPTWHTPTATETIKPIPPTSHIFGLNEKLSNDLFNRHPQPGVDLSLSSSRNGSNHQNGDLPTAPISLSVRDANKINSLPASVLQDLNNSVELKCTSPISKSLSPGLKSISPGLTFTSYIDNAKLPTSQKRSNIRVDSILERLNPIISTPNEKTECSNDKSNHSTSDKPLAPLQVATSHDENSNSSSILNLPTPKEEDAVSMYSNEDSLDSNKSRRKRKPSKTVRVSKDEPIPSPPIVIKAVEEKKVERRKSLDDIETPPVAKTRRKTSSESETIDNIAAMVLEGTNKEAPPIIETIVINDECAVASDTDTKDILEPVKAVQTPAQKKAANNNTSFVEVENKLEEMFAGIEDKDNVASTSSVKKKVLTPKKKKKRKSVTPPTSNESTPKKKKKLTKKVESPPLKSKLGKIKVKKIEQVKDVYAYDSGSNASSTRSKGPFIQIRGPRDSPISVSVVNTNEDDQDKKANKAKKFHDDSEYRHKVRSKGLHCSTLSNKYDAQTKDASWICAFCKRGPHASELSGPTSNCHIDAQGDLFGPYFISTHSPEFERRLDDPYDKQFKSKKVRRSLEEPSTSSAYYKKKSKRKYSDAFDDTVGDSIYLGITETNGETYEIWAHEDCIVWTPGIYLVGPKILGLEEAVWTCCNVACNYCGLKGANITCLKRGCARVMHLSCARSVRWKFDDENFRAYCPEHMGP